MSSSRYTLLKQDGHSAAIDIETVHQIEREQDAHIGVKKVEAAARLYGKYSKWILFLSLGLASYIYSLDASTTSAYLAFATSAFDQHSLIASIQVAQSLIVAVGKPVIAKLADVTSRATAFLAVLIFYVVGYLVIASAQNVGTIAGGIIIYAVGYTGLQILTQILIADTTTLQYRGLVSSLVSLPFLINGFIGPNLAAWVLKVFDGDKDDGGDGQRKGGNGWRVGYAMFAILVPLTLLPLIITLLWAERRAKILGIVDLPDPRSRDEGSEDEERSVNERRRYEDSARHSPSSTRPSSTHLRLSIQKCINNSTRALSHTLRTSLKTPIKHVKPHLKRLKKYLKKPLKSLVHWSDQLDLIGLILLGSSVSFVLLPVALVRRGLDDNNDNNSSITFHRFLPFLPLLSLLTFPLFLYWDFRIASRPVLPSRFLKNRTFVCAALIGFVDFMSFYLTFTYLYTFVLVVKPWSLLEATYFMQVQTIALTLFGFAGGVLMWWTRHYKPILIIGSIIRLIGVGLMIHSRGANASTAELIWTQVLQGLGGGLSASAMQVGAQASVTHIDVAMVTATVLLVTEVGGAFGGAVAGGIWSNTMPQNLEKFLPFLSDVERAKLFGDISSVLKIPRDDPVRIGVVQAYDETMKIMVIAATFASVLPVLLAFFMPNWYLSDKQNAVDEAGLDGEVDGDEFGFGFDEGDDGRDEEEGEGGFGEGHRHEHEEEGDDVYGYHDEVEVVVGGEDLEDEGEERVFREETTGYGSVRRGPGEG